MSKIGPTAVGDAHPYTRADVPWIIGEPLSCGKLILYISGGGMRTFGRTVSQEVVRRRQRRFLAVAAAIAVAWTALYVL